MQAAEILGKLVGFRSVVGLPNNDVVSWIRGYLETHGIAVDVLPGPEGDRLWVVITAYDSLGAPLSAMRRPVDIGPLVRRVDAP